MKAISAFPFTRKGERENKKLLAIRLIKEYENGDDSEF